ncbi:sulfite reductase flavoprotein subunit alpha [Herbaspirillum sp. YR522]|uniref:sulfite reductase flavoprotein subunit alpha n=1 Tax=Herbaspirillum sp. YR522 TaxID=1144342 RepID=UPI00026F6D5B|nr:sulfite reductase flavoprotein subunit alpha [Herbaspirillum sp. YR522]EJN09961.1 sulfite reductase, alpha subunit (flavoprotein) [Herbaspirillum sp. YR522]
MLKNIWFQIHWFIGITAGTILMTIGVSGAMISFREEIVDLLNPGVMHVAVRQQPALTPQQLLDAIGRVEPQRRVASLSITSAPGTAARVVFAPPPGQRRGEARYADPYTGALSGPLSGQEFFELTERFHRWLLLPTEVGKVVLGTLALSLLTLALSGLYLRWPRRPLSLQAWLRLDFRLSGRSLLWNLHSVIGTWALAMYVIFSVTGAYWALDWFKQGLNTLAGEGQAQAKPRANARGTPGGKGAQADDAHQARLDLTLAWDTFIAAEPDFANAQLRLPEKSTQPVQFIYLDPQAPHERARSRMTVLPQSGEVRLLERYADKSRGGQALAAIYPLHMGTYFGLPGRIIMTIASLMMPLFGITGWMLYLDRRRKKKALRAERESLQPDPPASPVGVATDVVAAVPAAPAATCLVAYASQTGQAERVALQTAALLRQSGVAVTLQSLARLTPEKLRHHQRILFIVSTFGQGDAPDSARGFERRLRMAAGQSLAEVDYALLALGDSHYDKFCGFGHTLDHWLQSTGATALFPMIEVDRMQPHALQQWQQLLADHQLISATAAPQAADVAHRQWRHWTLTQRRQLNVGSQGGGLFHLELRSALAQHWAPGALAEILPRQAPDRIALLLQRLQLDGDSLVSVGQRRQSLRETLATSALPAVAAPGSAQALADTLQALAPRTYSAASIAEDGALHLLVRQARHDDGLGLASGWLTHHANIGDTVQVRLADNANFAPASPDTPAIFIGNGSGLAGLRGHLRARVAAGAGRNWLLWGERNRAHDFLYRDELEGWLAAGHLARLDLAFSRDQQQRLYVQDRLREAADAVRQWIADGAVIFVCGSLHGMAAGVDEALVAILGQDTVDDLVAQHRYRRDVY